MATEYSCANCGSDIPELPSPEPQVCSQCVYITKQLHRVQLQSREQFNHSPLHRGRCQACGQASHWTRTAGIAHGWQEQHQREVIQAIHDEAFGEWDHERS